MLEKFTSEEIEQIKRELAIPKSVTKIGRLYGRRAVETPEWVHFLDKVLPSQINGIHTPIFYGSYDSCSIMFKLVDAILANYDKKKDRLKASNTVRIGQAQEYQDTALEVAEALYSIYEKHAATREKNINELFQEA